MGKLLRSNSRARTWVKKRATRLTKRMGAAAALEAALSEARASRLVNDGEAAELKDELSDAQELARGFHGRDNEAEFEEIESHQYRGELAQLGDLEELEIVTGDDLSCLTFTDSVRLGGSSDRKQLFLVGGDQELSDEFLDALEVGDKDKVMIGYVYSISYWTDKHHLVGSRGKDEAYMHCFGEGLFPNPAMEGRTMADNSVWMLEEKVSSGVLPMLVYDRLNKHMEFVGGGYEIRDEGIYN